MPIARQTAAGLARIGGPRTRQRAAVVAEHADDADGVDAQDKAGRAAHSCAHRYFGRKPRPRSRIRSGVGNLRFAQDAAIDADRRLQRFGRGFAARTSHANAIGAKSLDRHLGHVEHHVRRQIGRGIVDFVEKSVR